MRTPFDASIELLYIPPLLSISQENYLPSLTQEPLIPIIYSVFANDDFLFYFLFIYLFNNALSNRLLLTSFCLLHFSYSLYLNQKKIIFEDRSDCCLLLLFDLLILTCSVLVISVSNLIVIFCVSFLSFRNLS